MKRLCLTALIVSALLTPVKANADVVLDWNALAASLPTPNPFMQARVLAITQLAVFEAVNAITGDYEPYLGTVVAAAGASADAAAVAAALPNPHHLRSRKRGGARRGACGVACRDS